MANEAVRYDVIAGEWVTITLATLSKYHKIFARLLGEA